MASDLERRWHAEMLYIHSSAADLGYKASRFIEMVDRHGGLEAARRLIAYDGPSDGFTKLWEFGRLDLAVEARALKPEFRGLFSAAEVNICRRRLTDYGWRYPRPWEPPSRR